MKNKRSHSLLHSKSINTDFYEDIKNKLIHTQTSHTSQRHIIIYQTKNPTKVEGTIQQIDPTNQIKQIMRFKKNRCPLILKYYYEGKSILNTPTFPKNEHETRIILIENKIASQRYPIPPTANHELHHWYTQIQPKQAKQKDKRKDKKNDTKYPHIDITLKQLTKKQTTSLATKTSYYSTTINLLNLHNTPPNQLSDTSQYHRRIGVIPNALTPILRHMGIKHRHIHQTQSQIHKHILHGIHNAWQQDQNEIHKWHLPHSGAKPKKLTYPLQIQPIKRTRLSRPPKQKPKEQTQPTITETMGIHKLNKIASYHQYYKSQPVQTNRDTYTNEDEIISYKRKRYDQGAIQWTYNNSHIRATITDYSKYSEDHLKQLYYSITNTHFKSKNKTKKQKIKTRHRKDKRKKRKRQPSSKDTIINALLQIDNTFQALLTHHEWINTHLDTNYRIDIPAEPVYLQKLGVSTNNIDNEYKHWQQYNRWTPTPKLPNTKKRKANRKQSKTHKHKVYTWSTNQAIDIKGHEFNVNNPYIQATITNKIKDKWEVQLHQNPTKYYWSSEKLNEIAKPHSDLNAKYFDIGRCQICTEPTSYSYHTPTESTIMPSHKCKCGLIAHTYCMQWSQTDTHAPLCKYCSPNKKQPITNTKPKRYRIAYASYIQGRNIYIHKIPPSAHRCSYKPCKLPLTTIRSTPPIQTIPLSNNPTSAFTTRYTMSTNIIEKEERTDQNKASTPSTLHRQHKPHRPQKKKDIAPHPTPHLQALPVFTQHTPSTTRPLTTHQPLPTSEQKTAVRKKTREIPHSTSRTSRTSTHTNIKTVTHLPQYNPPASPKTPHLDHPVPTPTPTSTTSSVATQLNPPSHPEKRQNDPIPLNHNLTNWIHQQHRNQVKIPRNEWSRYEAIRIQRQEPSIPHLLGQMITTLKNSPNILYALFPPDDKLGRENHRRQRIQALTTMRKTHPSLTRGKGFYIIYDIMAISTLYNTEVFLLANNNNLLTFHPPTSSRPYPHYRRHTYPHFPNIPPTAIGLIHNGTDHFTAMTPSNTHNGGSTPPSPSWGSPSKTEGRRKGKRKGSTIHSKKTKKFKKQTTITTFWTDSNQTTKKQRTVDNE